MSLATVSLSVNDAEMMKKPTHIIMWQDDTVSTLVTSLTSRVEALEKLLSEKEFRTPLISGIDMKRRSDSLDCLSAVLPGNAAAVFKDLLAPSDLKTITIVPRSDITPDMDDETGLCEDEDEAEDQEAEDEADEDAAAEAEAQADEEDEAEAEAEDDAHTDVEEAEEDEALELEEFEYKGVTYYRNAADLQVYQLDTDGDIDDTPIGVWNEDKQKVLKYAKA